MPRVTEAVVGCLLRLYNLPSTRILASLDLSPVVAPFTELHYIHCGLGKSEESRIESSVTALLSILRSWPGIATRKHLELNPISLTTPPLIQVSSIFPTLPSPQGLWHPFWTPSTYQAMTPEKLSWISFTNHSDFR